MSEPRKTFVITITDKSGHDVPLSCRLRRFLKDALRQYGLRVVSISDEITQITTERIEANGTDQSVKAERHSHVASASDPKT